MTISFDISSQYLAWIYLKNKEEEPKIRSEAKVFQNGEHNVCESVQKTGRDHTGAKANKPRNQNTNKQRDQGSEEDRPRKQ